MLPITGIVRFPAAPDPAAPTAMVEPSEAGKRSSRPRRRDRTGVRAGTVALTVLFAAWVGGCDDGTVAPAAFSDSNAAGKAAPGTAQASGNRPPTASRATTRPLTMEAGDTLLVDAAARFSDADGDSLTYAVETTDGGVVEASHSGGELTVRAVREGRAIVTVTATDPHELTASFLLRLIVVQPNLPPVTTAGTFPPYRAEVGDTMTVNLASVFSSPDVDSLSFAATTSDPGVLTVSTTDSTAVIAAVGAGMAMLTATATDPAGLSARTTMQVTVVTPPNQAPVAPASTVPPQTVEIGNTVEIDLAPYATDPDGDPLEFAVQTSDPGVVVASVEGSKVMAVAMGLGTAVLTATATDPESLFVTMTIPVTVVEPAEQPPVALFAPIPPQTVDVGDERTLNLASYFSDPNGDALSFAVDTSDPAVAAVSIVDSIASAVAVWTGTATLTATVTDPGGLFVTASVEVTVREPAVGLPESMISGELAEVDAAALFNDVNGELTSYEVATSDPQVVYILVDSLYVPRTEVRLKALEAGTADVRVTAIRPGGRPVSRSATVTVRANRPPETTGELPDYTIMEGDAVTFDVSPYFSDPDGDPLRYVADACMGIIPGCTPIVEASISGSLLTLAALQPGQEDVAVRALDPGGYSVRLATRVTIPVNQGPQTVGSSLPRRELVVGETVTLDANSHFTDPEGDPLSFEATISDPDAVEVTTAASIVRLRGLAPARGLILTVTARDQRDREATLSGRARVRRNRSPSVSEPIPPQSLRAPATITLDVAPHFRDPDGHSLVYGATTSDAGIVEVSASNSTVSFTGVAAGTAQVTVTATDPGLLEAAHTVEVTVATNRAPRRSSSFYFLQSSLAVGRGSVQGGLNGWFTDPDGDSLEVVASSSDNSVLTAVVANDTLTLAARSPGTVQVTVAGYDPAGLSASVVRTVTVTSPPPRPDNRPPTTSGDLRVQRVFVDQKRIVDLGLFFSDPDRDPLDFGTPVTSDPTVLAASVDGQFLTLTGVSPGTADISVTASDPSGLSATASRSGVQVLVRPTDLENQPPVIIQESGGENIPIGVRQSFDLDTAIEDPEGDLLRYEVTSSDPTIVSVTLHFRSILTLLGLREGSVLVTVTAFDSEGLSVSGSGTVTVVGRNR